MVRVQNVLERLYDAEHFAKVKDKLKLLRSSEGWGEYMEVLDALIDDVDRSLRELDMTMDKELLVREYRKYRAIKQSLEVARNLVTDIIDKKETPKITLENFNPYSDR